MSRASLLEYLEAYRGSREIACEQPVGYRKTRWTYGRIADTAAQFSLELERHGVSKGDRVLLWGENRAEWVSVFWGCLLRGAVVVPIDKGASLEFAERVTQQVDAKLLVCSRDLPGVRPGRPTVSLDSVGENQPVRSSARLAPQELQRSDPIEIIFTSGTTSDPKGVVLTHGNVLANLEPLEAEISKYRKYERFVHPLSFLSMVPLSHVFGQFMGLFVPGLIRGRVVFGNSFNPGDILTTIRRDKIWVVVAVPRVLESLKDKLRRDIEATGWLASFEKRFQTAEGLPFLKRWWSFRSMHRRLGWRFIALISGGATLDDATEAFWLRLGFAVIQGYGLTETTSLVTLNHPFRSRKGSIGQALAGREIRLAENGEVLVRGESVASGYWGDRDFRPADGEGQWFHTGDLGEIDEHGNVYFKGRAKNVLVTSAGMNIYPEDLEAALRRQPEIRDCVVVGLDREGNEEPFAVVILRTDASRPRDDNAAAKTAAKTAIDRANESLAEYQQIRQWMVWPGKDFPRTPTQKPKLDSIQAVVHAQRVGKLGGSPPADDRSSPVAALIHRIQSASAASNSAVPDTELNLTSLDRVELLSALEDRYQTSLDEDRFAAAKTVGDLERLLQQPAGSASQYPYPQWQQRWPVTWVRLFAYYLLTWPATLLLGWPRVGGRDHLRDLRGPVLIISNHVTEIDIGFILAALPTTLRHHISTAMNGQRLKSMRHPPEDRGLLSGWLDRVGYFLVVALFNVFPMPKQGGVRASFEFAGESADRGNSVLIFPEGEITKDGRIGRFRAGIGVLAERLALPVVPLRIKGLYELRQAGKKMARPGVVQVIIGTPVRFEPGADPQKIAEELQERMMEL